MTAFRALIVWLGILLLAMPRLAGAGFVTFESGQVRPLALSSDGSRLYAVNTPDGRLEVFAVDAGGLTHLQSVPVGLEPVAVAVRNDGEVWVVNHLSDSISVVDVASTPHRTVRTLLVGDEPRDLVFAGPGHGRAFVTTAPRGHHRPGDPQLTTPGVGRADVWVFDAAAPGPEPGGVPLTIVTLFTDTPRALAATPDGTTVYAAGFHSGNQTTTVVEGAVCNGGTSAPPCNVGGLPVPGGLPGPNTNFQGITRPETGLIVRYDQTSGGWLDQLGRDWRNAVKFNLPDRDVFAIDATANPPVETAAFTHVGTVLFNMIVNPVSGAVYVSNSEARNEVRFEGPGVFGGSTVRGHLQEARITVLDGLGVHPRHLNKHIDYAVVPSPVGVKERSLALPLGMAITADGTTLYVAAFGSSAVGVYDTGELEADTFVPAVADHIPVSGGGPSGLVLDETRHRLYVLTRFDDAVSVIDTQTRDEIAHIPLFDPEPTSVVVGRPVLYDARLTSSNGEAACAVCHIFGDFDSLAWDLGNPDDVVVGNANPKRLDDFFGISFPGFHPMKGPMATQSLRGMANHGPMHWRGDRTGADVGQGLDESLAFQRFIVAFDGLLGRGGPISTSDMQAFTDFILQVTYPPNPIRALDNSLTPDEQAGHDFFFGPTSDVFSDCNGCHVLAPNQGFFGGDGLTSFEGETQLFKIPHLRNLYQKVGMFGFPSVGFVTGGDHGHKGDQMRGFGFLHDGSFDTLFRFHNGLVFSRDFTAFGPNPGGFPSGPTGDAMRRQVERFMLAFDTNLAPIVGQQATLTATNGAAVGARIDLMLARAAAGECEVAVKGFVGGKERGWVSNPDGTFATDLAGEPAVTDAALRALAATPGQELNYVCAPPANGARIGIDRDDDGVPDRTEVDEGTDPLNPASVPGGGPWLRIRTASLALRDQSVPTSSPGRRRFSYKAFTQRLGPLADRILPPTPGSAGDPTLGGAVLSVYNAAGVTGDRVTVALPATGWRALRNGYRFSGGRAGPISGVVVRFDGIVVKGGGSTFGYSLDEVTQERVAVRLTLGSGIRWCAEAPAAIDRTDRFVGQRDAAPPAFCPPMP
jgi:YVTN family beta-propeller protein